MPTPVWHCDLKGFFITISKSQRQSTSLCYIALFSRHWDKFYKISIKLVNCTQTDQLDAAEQISCPHLLVEAEDGAKFDPEIFQQIVQVQRLIVLLAQWREQDKDNLIFPSWSGVRRQPKVCPPVGARAAPCAHWAASTCRRPSQQIPCKGPPLKYTRCKALK